MFKGLQALFTTGMIIHPMVLIGIVAGAVFAYKFDAGTIIGIFSYYDYYMVAFTAAFLFTIFFDMVFKYRGHAVDWKATFARAIANFVKLFIANVASAIFFYMLIF